MGSVLIEKEVAAYLAGIVDGEGNVALMERSAKRKSGEISPTFLDYVKIANTDYRLLAWIREKTGVGSIYKESRRKGLRQVYVWHVSSRQCVSFLEAIYPYLVIKKEQARLILLFRETFDKWRFTSGRRVSNATLATRKWYCAEMVRLHKEVTHGEPLYEPRQKWYEHDPVDCGL